MDKLSELSAEAKRDLDIDDNFEHLHQESYKNQRIRTNTKPSINF
jgi:hypothetical protein